MLTGYNHNIRYKDRIYHIQTEDLGNRMHVVTTQLFLGGNVLAGHKVDYQHLLEEAELSKRLRVLMQDQHKKVIRCLLQGSFDEAIESYVKQALL